MPIPSLPNELIDQILSYECLKEEDLQTACLVSKSWLEPSRRSLYHSIDLYLRRIEPCDGPLSPPRITYRLDTASWQLFSVLNQKPGLAAMVKEINLMQTTSVEDIPSIMFTTPADLLSSLFLLLPNASSFSFDTDEWFAGEAYGSLLPHLDRIQTLNMEDFDEDRWFQLAVRIPDLRSLHVRCFAEETSLNRSTPSKSRLESLVVELDCVKNFKALTFGSKLSLRSLTIQQNLVHALDLSQFPNLLQLSIHAAFLSSQRISKDVTPFLGTLRDSTSLVKIRFPSSFIKTHDGSYPGFHGHLPLSCRRIDIDRFWTVNEIVAATQKRYGSQLAQLGLTYAVKGQGKRKLLVAGARAVAEEAGVEIIWLDG
ncbi:hypothetical protein JCM3765_000139 [Sporobolomyces pararoseus]